MLIFRLQIFYDINITIGKKSLSAHKVIIASHSEYFCKMFSGNFKEIDDKEIIINCIGFNVFQKLVNFMYTSILEINLHNVQVKIIFLNKR